MGGRDGVKSRLRGRRTAGEDVKRKVEIDDRFRE